MCELLGISSDEPTRLALEWDEFSAHGSPAAGNPDGWGVGYYQGADVATYREPLPAADSPCSDLLGLCAPPSTTAIAHVRRAVAGAAVLANCQPFAKPLFGHMHLFAHNGFVAGTDDMMAGLAPSLLPIGDTDSERLFALLLSKLEIVWSRGPRPTIRERCDVVSEFASQMREAGALNFLYCDGELLFAHGHRRTIPGDDISTDPGLYLLERGEDCREAMDVPLAGLRQAGRCSRQTLVATTPLNDQLWAPLGYGELICLRDGGRVA